MAKTTKNPAPDDRGMVVGQSLSTTPRPSSKATRRPERTRAARPVPDLLEFVSVAICDAKYLYRRVQKWVGKNVKNTLKTAQ